MLNRKWWVPIVALSVLLIGSILWKEVGGSIMGEDNKKENRLIDKDKVTKIKDTGSEKLATKEFLIETFHVSEKDIKKYEVEEVISAYGLTEDFFLHEKENFSEPLDVISVFARLQEDFHTPAEKEKYDFSYLYKAKEYTGELPDVSTIKYLAASNYVGDGGSSFVIDFENNKIYCMYHTAVVDDDIRYADKVTNITEEERKIIINALKEAEINKWKHSYVNKKEPSGEVFWDFGVEFNDGTIVSFNGKGGSADTYPKFRDMILKNISKESQ